VFSLQSHFKTCIDISSTDADALPGQ